MVERARFSVFCWNESCCFWLYIFSFSKSVFKRATSYLDLSSTFAPTYRSFWRHGFFVPPEMEHTCSGIQEDHTTTDFQASPRIIFLLVRASLRPALRKLPPPSTCRMRLPPAAGHRRHRGPSRRFTPPVLAPGSSFQTAPFVLCRNVSCRNLTFNFPTNLLERKAVHAHPSRAW